MSLCLSSCCWAFCSSLRTQFLAPSVIPRKSNESCLAKTGLAAAAPFWTWIRSTSLRKGGSRTLQQQLSFSPVSRILQSGCFLCWVYIQAGGRLEECRRARYKKNPKPPSRLHCLLSPATLLREILSAPKWSTHSSFSTPTLLPRQELFPSTATSILCVTLWFSSRREQSNGVLCGHSAHLTFKYLAQLTQGTSRRLFIHLKL